MSPISATTTSIEQILSLFVPLDQTFIQLVHATTFVLSDYIFCNVCFCFQLSTTHTSMFPFRSTFGALDFRFGFLSLSTFVLSPLTLHLSPDSLSHSAYSASHFFRRLICFFYFLFISSRSTQFRGYPKTRRCDPCSKDFLEVTHLMSYFEVC